VTRTARILLATLVALLVLAAPAAAVPGRTR
jgi:hypothetical protein